MSKGVRSRAAFVGASTRCRAAVHASMRSFRHGTAAFASMLVVGVAAPAVAQDDASRPQLLEGAEPEAPTNAAGVPLEGWVKVHYSVLANGTTSDVRVVDVVPPQLDTDDVVSAVEEWKFTPATIGGEAVDWHNNESMVVFDAESVPFEPSPLFAQAYADVTQLIEQEDFEGAIEANESLLENQTMRLNEIGLAEIQAAILLAATSNLHDAYEAVLRSTDPEVVTLQGPQLAVALRQRFNMELQLGRFASSLETYDRLAAIEVLSDQDDVKVRADKVREALQAGAAITVKGRVGGAPWSYAPTNRTFSFTGVEGSIRNLQLECNRRKTELEFSEDVEWSIPQSWGDCMLFVDGRRDTSFTLVEFPEAPEQAQ